MIDHSADMAELTKADEMTFGGIATSISKRFSQKIGRPFSLITIENFRRAGELALFGDGWA